jgi:hypothetical protein
MNLTSRKKKQNPRTKGNAVYALVDEKKKQLWVNSLALVCAQGVSE